MAYYTLEQCTRVYRQFKLLDPTGFRAVIHFVEEHWEIIKHLPFDAYFELSHAYSNALFETGSYSAFFHQVDDLIEMVMTHNMYSYQGDPDIYATLLFRKAAAAYQLMKFTEAISILEALKRINPQEAIYPGFQAKCLRAIKPPFLRQLRALSILFFLLSATVISLEILAVRPIWPTQLLLCMQIRNGLFVSGLLMLVGGETTHWAKSRITAFKGYQKKKNC